MTLLIETISYIGQAQIDRFIRLEELVIAFSRNMMILMLTPLFTLYIFECATYCYRLALRFIVGNKINSRSIAALKFKEVQVNWTLNYEWTRKFIGKKSKGN